MIHLYEVRYTTPTGERKSIHVPDAQLDQTLDALTAAGNEITWVIA